MGSMGYMYMYKVFLGSVHIVENILILPKPTVNSQCVSTCTMYM